ncbi:hypothetical protein SCA6_008028 [Theobroma cacao]
MSLMAVLLENRFKLSSGYGIQQRKFQIQSLEVEDLRGWQLHCSLNQLLLKGKGKGKPLLPQAILIIKLASGSCKSPERIPGLRASFVT